MTTDKLYLRYARSSAEIDRVDVKQRRTVRLGDIEFNLAIIGNSHYIEAPGISFYEMVSCVSPRGSRSPDAVVPLTDGVTDQITHQTANYTVETAIDVQPLSDCPSPESADMSYRFGEGAYTTITHTSVDPTYRTYHTYPEYQLGVCTTQMIQSASDDSTTARPHSH
ncbi:MAG: protein of unknown function DUF2617 [uncultured archaeon A07HR60]|jgi:Protein of unknown function DUF2617.|nr:MAG: protein of unknown function DUF2617 [Halorubrum sp. J07HR59]ESS10413.1 MAG: protein of unknown function DUF2617 [uncultured archaeon A07HR60]